LDWYPWLHTGLGFWRHYRYNLPDETGTALRAQLKAIRPEMPVLLFDGIGRQTPFMLRFFDSYLRNAERFGDGTGDWDE
jgi:hypothetical protein